MYITVTGVTQQRGVGAQSEWTVLTARRVLMAVCRVSRMRGSDTQVLAGLHPAPTALSPELPCGPAMMASVIAGKSEARGSTPAATSASTATIAAPPTSFCSPSATVSGTNLMLWMQPGATRDTILIAKCFAVKDQLKLRVHANAAAKCFGGVGDTSSSTCSSQQSLRRRRAWRDARGGGAPVEHHLGRDCLAQDPAAAAAPH